MAAVTKLELKFFDSDGQVMTHNYNYTDPEASVSNVSSFVNAIIANKTIFAKAPQSLKSASFVTTERENIDINS